MAVIYHNPRCRKSRETLALLQEKNVEIQVVEYLKESPSVDDLKKIVQLLGINPVELIRRGEKVFKEQYKGKKFSDDEWLKILSETPILIERPIVVHANKAVIGRPPENIHNIF